MTHSFPTRRASGLGALIATGRAEEAKPHFAAAIDISKDANFDKWVAVTQGTETGDYAAAISALRSPEFQIPEEPRAGLLSGYQALASGNAQAKTKDRKSTRLNSSH